MTLIKNGDIVPMLSLTQPNGESWSRSQWRGKAALAIVVIPPLNTLLWQTYLDQFDDHAKNWDRNQHAVLVSPQPSNIMPKALSFVLDPDYTIAQQVWGIACGGWLIIDRYGQLYQHGYATTIEDIPTPTKLHEWIEWVDMMCGS